MQGFETMSGGGGREITIIEVVFLVLYISRALTDSFFGLVKLGGCVWTGFSEKMHKIATG